MGVRSEGPMFAGFLSAVLCLFVTDVAVTKATVSSATANPIATRFWGNSYAKAIRDVRRTDKPLFVVLDRGSAPVGKMVAEGPFMSKEIDEAIEADYVRLFIDTESELGQKLAGQFDATTLPRLVIIDRTGEWQVYRKSGVHSPDEVSSLLARFRQAKISSNDSVVRETRQVVSGSSWSPATCKT